MARVARLSEVNRGSKLRRGSARVVILFSLARKLNFAGHMIVTTGLRRMYFPRPGIFLRWNSNLQQVDFRQGFASNNILGLVVLAVNGGFLYLHV